MSSRSPNSACGLECELLSTDFEEGGDIGHGFLTRSRSCFSLT